MATVIFKKDDKPKYVPGTETFTYEGKKYSVLIHACIIEGQKMTAADIAADENAQKYLVEKKCIGSVIDEVFDEAGKQSQQTGTDADDDIE